MAEVLSWRFGVDFYVLKMIHSLVLLKKYIFYFFIILRGMWDLSSLTDQDQTDAPVVEAQGPNPWPPGDFLE